MAVPVASLTAVDREPLRLDEGEARTRFAAYLTLAGLCRAEVADVPAAHLLADAGEHDGTPAQRLAVAVGWAQSGLLAPFHAPAVSPFAGPLPAPAWNRRVVAVPREVHAQMPIHRFVDPVEALLVSVGTRLGRLRRGWLRLRRAVFG
ncbi:MAG: hypothetical protein RLZZ127_285 [Planctomycetota bacterium]|jgi:hypothetical protein